MKMDTTITKTCTILKCEIILLHQASAERVQSHDHALATARLKEALDAQGGTPAGGDAIASRLAELKGIPHTPDQALKRQVFCQLLLHRLLMKEQ